MLWHLSLTQQICSTLGELKQLHGVTRKAAHDALSITPQTGVDLDRSKEMAGNINCFVFKELLLFLNLSKWCRTVKIGESGRIPGKGMKERSYANLQSGAEDRNKDLAGGWEEGA